MKKIALKPGFEFIFSLGIMVILGLPPVFAQATKDVQITITNGDTTVNGKNIKELPPKERQDALSEIKHINTITVNSSGANASEDVVIEKPGPDSLTMAAHGPHRMGRVMKFRLDHARPNDSTFAFNYRMNEGRPHPGDDIDRQENREWRFNGPEDGPMMFNRRNTQNFVYTTTDNDGVSTRVSYHVSVPSGAVAHVPGESEPSQYELLDVKDLSLVPEFSSGKTVLTFNLPAKAAAEVTFKDNQGNIIWADKAVNGSFSKAFSLGLNGVYYLHIKQGGKMAVKKIMKD